MDIFEQCPKCGKITEGIPIYGTKRQAVRSGVQWATKKVLIYLLTPLIFSIFGLLGTVLGFIVAFIILAYIFKTAENITNSVDLSMYSLVPFEFRCPHCGHAWKRTYEKGVDFTTDFVLKWQRTCLVEKIRGDANTALGTAIVAGIICAPCVFYCLTHLSGRSDYLLWWLLFIIGLPALGISINCGVKSHDKNQEAYDLENMSVSSFRHSSYRAGNPFVGVVKPLDKTNEVNTNQVNIPKIKQIKETSPNIHDSVEKDYIETSDSVKEDIAKLDELLAAGILTEKEHAEQIKKIAPTTLQPTTKAQIENNKIAILKNLKLLLDSGVLSYKEFLSQKSSTLGMVSIPWDKNKSRYEILEEMKSLLDADILSQEEFDFHKKALLSDNN